MPLERLVQKMLGGSEIAPFAEPELNPVAIAIDGSVSGLAVVLSRLMSIQVLAESIELILEGTQIVSRQSRRAE